MPQFIPHGAISSAVSESGRAGSVFPMCASLLAAAWPRFTGRAKSEAPCSPALL